jgi:RNA polymerase sigma-70 factor, ECF subfamily
MPIDAGPTPADSGIFPRLPAMTSPPVAPLSDSPASADPVVAGKPLTVDVDAALVQRAVAGEAKAFELLVIKYQRRVERLIGRMVRDVDLVPDIAQETFIRAYRALANFRGESQFYTWLYRIAVNTAKKHLLDMKRNPVVVMSALNWGGEDETSNPDAELSWAAQDTETPEAVLASKEIAQAVNAVMDALPEELRQAITLREIEGLSYEDIAQALGCPIGTVRSRIFRAREAISARIKPMLDRQTGKRW